MVIGEGLGMSIVSPIANIDWPTFCGIAQTPGQRGIATGLQWVRNNQIPLRKSQQLSEGLPVRDEEAVWELKVLQIKRLKIQKQKLEVNSVDLLAILNVFTHQGRHPKRIESIINKTNLTARDEGSRFRARSRSRKAFTKASARSFS